ncbi:Peroxisomal membrane protein 2 [Galdieria sulphuraria]|nr:Peroxisomal membrane protein 2 [Galdieria sulphuraria]
MSWLGRWMRSYHQLLMDKPVMTKSVTCGILSFAGDVAAQYIEQKYSNRNSSIIIHLDMQRTLRFTSFGLLIFGPCAHYWYRLLDHWFPKATTRSLISKVLVDQTLFTPVAIVSVFSYVSLLEGHPFVAVQKVKQDFWTTLKANWALWLPAQTINFRFTPPDYRLPNVLILKRL